MLTPCLGLLRFLPAAREDNEGGSSSRGNQGQGHHREVDATGWVKGARVIPHSNPAPLPGLNVPGGFARSPSAALACPRSWRYADSASGHAPLRVHGTPGMGCTAWQEEGAQHGEDRVHAHVDGVHSMPRKGCGAHQGRGAQHPRAGVLRQTSNQQHPTSPAHHLQLLSWERPTDTGCPHRAQSPAAVPPALPAGSPHRSAGPTSAQACPYKILGKAA